MSARVVDGYGTPSLNGINFILALCENQIGSLHIGIGYFDETLGWCLAHQAWHNDLVLQQIRGRESGYIWVLPILAEDDADSLRAAVRLFCFTNGLHAVGDRIAVPYGFSAYIGWLRAVDARIEIPPNGVGLNCATFVLAIYHHAVVDLVDLTDWPSREADTAVQGIIVANLAIADSEQAEKVRAEIGNIRVRPEEVAGASICESQPARFNDVQRPSRYIRSRVPARNR